MCKPANTQPLNIFYRLLAKNIMAKVLSESAVFAGVHQIAADVRRKFCNTFLRTICDAIIRPKNGFIEQKCLLKEPLAH
jgi:hypothetical protein